MVAIVAALLTYASIPAIGSAGSVRRYVVAFNYAFAPRHGQLSLDKCLYCWCDNGKAWGALLLPSNHHVARSPFVRAGQFPVAITN